MEIKITDNKRITTDKRQWIYAEKIGERWNAQLFYSDLTECYSHLLNYLTRNSDKKALKDALEESVKRLEGLRTTL